LKYFYDCLEQPKRSNGGYEESRELIFEYLYGYSSSEAIDKIKSGEATAKQLFPDVNLK